MNLENKIMLVTGGSSGIGFSIARLAKNRGANVIICGRNPEKLVKASREFNFTHYVCDVSEDEQVVNMFENIKRDFGGLDVLINNAGFGYFAPLDEIDSTKFLDVYKTNVLGAALCGREAAKIFKQQKSGNIVNIASTAALKGFASGSPYVATKFALRGMSECWHAELRKFNVRVILVNPSEVQTEFIVNAGGSKRNFNPTKLISDDIAHAVISALEMNDRGFIPELTVFATNPVD